MGRRGVLRASDVGHRVVVRRYVGIGRHGRPIFTDLLGDLLSIDSERLVIRADDGAEHAVPVDDVAAAKPIPARPVRHSEIISLERVADRAWPAPEHQRLGDWFLRAASGFTNRANSALPLGHPGMPLDAAISACATWYDERALTPRITVPLPLHRRMADSLTVRGWAAQPVVLVQAAALTDVLTEVPPAASTDLREAPSNEFLSLVASRKGGLPAAAIHVLTAVSPVRFAEVRRDDGTLCAIARGAIVDDWLHIGLVEVIESARRRGYAREVSLSLARWAAQAGALRAFLQVEELNRPAIDLYSGLGFTTHHRYVTFHAPGR